MIRFLAIVLLLTPCLWAAEDHLNIITYNIRNDNPGDRGIKNWDDRKDTLVAYLLGHKTSIIGFQEVKHNQLLDLVKALPDYAHTGLGRDDGKTAGEYSPIFFDRLAWKIDPDQHGTYWLSDTPDVIASRTWGNSHNRICSWARLIRIKGPDQGKAIYVYNTHWDHRSQPSRVESGKLMLQRIKARQHQDEPYILMGDLNATTDNPAVKQLLDSGFLIDHGKEQKRTWSGWKSALIPDLRIDHVFTSPGIAEAIVVVDSNGDGKGNAASDHHPVRLTVPEPFLKPASKLNGTTGKIDLPRVLVVGDSISMNYHEAAKTALNGVADYHRNEGNCFSTAHGVNNMELWLGNYHEPGLHWDVIQFNHGLHDLKQAYDKETGTFGAYAVPLDDYKANLEQEIAIMKKTGATLIWCSTTPVPNSNKGKYARRKGAAAEFNKAAMEVMRKHPDIIINDLHKVISKSPVFDNWRRQNDVHFYKKEERQILGESVAKTVKLALKLRSKR